MGWNWECVRELKKEGRRTRARWYKYPMLNDDASLCATVRNGASWVTTGDR
jgi:hypothetical protein